MKMMDIGLNYPLWIAAKRAGAGMSLFPNNINELYRVNDYCSVLLHKLLIIRVEQRYGYL